MFLDTYVLVARGLFVKNIRMHVENMISIVDSYSQFNEGDLNDHINEHENVNFVNKL